MTSSENIDKTIARLRRRVLEIDALIAEIEHGGIPAFPNRGENARLIEFPKRVETRLRSA